MHFKHCVFYVLYYNLGRTRISWRGFLNINVMILIIMYRVRHVMMIIMYWRRQMMILIIRGKSAIIIISIGHLNAAFLSGLGLG